MLDKNTADYSVKHYIEMFKSIFSNHKDIAKFNIRDLEKNRRRKNLVIQPKEKNNDFQLEQYKKCGIDIGVRIFLTTYSKNASYEIGTNTNQIIDRINKRLDNIKQSKDLKRISNEKYIKLNYKYRDKLSNLIKDMHNKVVNFLLSL